MSEDVIAVDARGLEPPQPLVRILESLASLPDGAAMRAQTDRRPMHLYGFLEERGFIGTSEEQPDGSFVTVIRRK
jgi:TusA-related sulfurtransferase